MLDQLDAGTEADTVLQTALDIVPVGLEVLAGPAGLFAPHGKQLSFCGTSLATSSLATAPPIPVFVPAAQELVWHGPLPLPLSGGGQARRKKLLFRCSA